jgi:ribose 5-phosphate isomerase B
MNIAIGSDEHTPITDAVLADVRKRGHAVVLDLTGAAHQSPDAPAPLPWPAVARAVAEAVRAGTADEGILFCYTGTGVSMAANKVPGIRAALCDDAETARGARLWNNANVLCLSLRRTSAVVAREILDMWFNTSFIPNEEDDACLRALAEIEADCR